MENTIFIPMKWKRELRILSVCFVIGFLINVGAIIAYVRPWTELFSQIGYVIFIALTLYFIVVFFRLLFWCVKKTFNRNNKQKKI